MNLIDLLNVLHEVTAQWYAFGIQLEVPTATLDTFQTADCCVQHYLSVVLKRWMGKHPPPKIQDIITALRKPVIQNKKLASELEEAYKGNQC